MKYKSSFLWILYAVLHVLYASERVRIQKGRKWIETNCSMCNVTQNVLDLFVRKVVIKGGVQSWTLIMLDKKIFVTSDMGLFPRGSENYIFSLTVDKKHLSCFIYLFILQPTQIFGSRVQLKFTKFACTDKENKVKTGQVIIWNVVNTEKEAREYSSIQM